MTEPNSIEWEDHHEEIPEFTKMVESSTHPEMQDINPNEEFSFEKTSLKDVIMKAVKKVKIQ